MEIIIKYDKDLILIGKSLGIKVEDLGKGYAIIDIPRERIVELYDVKQIEYFEFSKLLSYKYAGASLGKKYEPVKDSELLGKGILVSVIDSGIEYDHPDFLDEFGNTKIKEILDQTSSNDSNPIIISEDEINFALKNNIEIPHTDVIGHGTMVAGIINGNTYGIAPQTSLLIVKLKYEDNFVTSTNIMRAIKYSTDKAIELNMPLVINLSYGTNDDSHDGNSLFETYISEMAKRWKTSIVIGSGNEGGAGHYFESEIASNESRDMIFKIGSDLKHLHMSLFKTFCDDLAFEIYANDDTKIGEINKITPWLSAVYQDTYINAQIIDANHYNENHLVYFDFYNEKNLPEGLWKIRIKATNIVNGYFRAWLPTVSEVSKDTSFSNSSENFTKTIPSTARNVICVGAYDSGNNVCAYFSGRTPDLVAPGVNIMTTSLNKGYDLFTGTSAATPHVAGAAAIMMEWGIINHSDPFLYGEKIKAYVKKGAVRQTGKSYPDSCLGYGLLNIKNTLRILRSENYE